MPYKYIFVTIGNQQHCCLVDSGSDISFLSMSKFKEIEPFVRNFQESSAIYHGITGHSPVEHGNCTMSLGLPSQTINVDFKILTGVTKHIVLGNDFLYQQGVRLEYSDLTMAVGRDILMLHQKGINKDLNFLVKAKETKLISPQSVGFVQLEFDGNLKGDCLIVPQANSPLFQDEPGVMAPSVVGTVGGSMPMVLPIVNNTGKVLKVSAKSILAVAQDLKALQSENIEINAVDITEQEDENDKKTDFNLDHLDNTTKGKLISFLHKFERIFAATDKELGRTGLVKLGLDTGDHPPIRQRPYRCMLSKQKLVEEHIEDMLNSGIIRHSSSPWASPVVVIPKRDGTCRFCVDFRKINAILVKNGYPLPNIQDIFSHMGKSKYFTTLDLKSGYWQIEVKESDRCKTAFVTHKGLYEFNVMAFGIATAPSVFQDLMNKVLSGIGNEYAMAYLDDVIVFSETLEDHFRHLEDVFERLESAGLKLKKSKCEFLKKEIHYLGHIISDKGIRPDEAKIDAIRNLPAPTTVKDVRAFIGMVGFYRNFITHFAETAKPLTALTKKNCRFSWSSEAQEAFDALKCKLIEAPILAYPDVNLPYKLYTDASNTAVGAMLTQVFPEGERAIQYLSHQLSDSQAKWPVIEREGYSIIYAITKLRHFLLGSEFTVYTDHKPLRTLFTAEMRNTRVQRWAILIAEYGCDIQYFPGKKNVCADLMSRVWQNGASNDINIINSDVAKKIVNDEAEDKTRKVEIDEGKVVEELKVNSVRYAQYKDKEVKGLIERIKQGTVRKGEEDYLLDNNTLYHIPSPIKRDKSPRMQLVIPIQLRPLVLRACHEQAGHLGIDRTYEKIRKRYFWPGMYMAVVDHVQKCEPCMQRRIRKKRTMMQDMPMPEYPFEIVGIDTVGPYPESANGHIYVITVVDHFSGWPEAYPTRDKTAETVAKVLLTEFLPRHACPKVITSDRGTEFCNGIIDSLSIEMNIQRIRTTPYHPQANGKTERFHRVMNDMLAKSVKEDQSNWDECIPAALMAYRTSVNETTQHTPFFLVHGRDPVLPIDTLLEPKFKYYGEEYLPTMMNRLHLAYQEVKENTRDAREHNKAVMSDKAELRAYEVGDPVFWHDKAGHPGTSDKLSLSWKRYWRVLEVLSPVNVKIRNQETGKEKVVHVDHIHPAHPDTVWDVEHDNPRQVCHKSRNVNRPEPERAQPLRHARLAHVPPKSNKHNEKAKLVESKGQEVTQEEALDRDITPDRDISKSHIEEKQDEKPVNLSNNLSGSSVEDDGYLKLTLSDQKCTADHSSGYNLRPRAAKSFGDGWLQRKPQRGSVVGKRARTLDPTDPPVSLAKEQKLAASRRKAVDLSDLPVPPAKQPKFEPDPPLEIDSIARNVCNVRDGDDKTTERNWWVNYLWDLADRLWEGVLTLPS